MVIPVVFLLLVVVSPTAAITLDTDGAFNARLVDARGIGGGGDGGLGLGFIAAPLIGLALLAAIAGSSNTVATMTPVPTTIVCPVCPPMPVCPTPITPCTPVPACPANYQRIGIPAGVAGAGTILQSCYRVITAAVDFRAGAQLCTANNAVPVEFNTPGEFAAVSTLLAGNAGMYFTGHTDAFNTVANVILGINSGLPAVGVNFPNGGNAALTECGVLTGAVPSSPICTGQLAGIICEIRLDGTTCFCPAGTG